MDSSQIAGWVFDALALIFFIVVTRLLLSKTSGEKLPVGAAVLAAFLAVFCAVMGNPDRFDTMSFSLTGGVQTKARQAIQQVQVTIAQLQKLAASLAAGSFNELAFSGQVFVGMSSGEKFRAHDKIVNSLKELGLNPEDILETQRVWIFVYCNILEGMIEALAKEQLPPSTDVEAEISKLPRDAEHGSLPSPDTLRKWVISKVLKDPKLAELLNEYGNVWTTGTMQNPDLIPFGAGPRVTGLKGLPTSPQGLKPGDAWNDGGILAVLPLARPEQTPPKPR